MYKLLEKDRFDEMYKIMEQSFPPDERRTCEGQKAILDEDNYRVYIYEKDEKIVAFFTVWFLEGFVFAEHFAVDENYRGEGIGTGLIKSVLASVDVPVVLEIELESSSQTAKRRGDYYRRLGFNVSLYEYQQPSYGEGKEAIPMHLVSYPDALCEDEFLKYKKIIYKEIYKLEL